uniref:DSBA-like thioredoxin domain-containing protein n=1 Tax=Pseudonaja textilis TaxID=8673 RepID=A0A670ZQ66_PSETE
PSPLPPLYLKKKVAFFYDVLSPYSWLGFEIICRYRPIWNLDLHLRPVFLAGIMKATGNDCLKGLSRKGQKDYKAVREIGLILPWLEKQFESVDWSVAEERKRRGEFKKLGSGLPSRISA